MQNAARKLKKAPDPQSQNGPQAWAHGRVAMMQNDTKDLEKAAGEMAQAASRLVEIERNILSITQDGVSPSASLFQACQEPWDTSDVFSPTIWNARFLVVMSCKWHTTICPDMPIIEPPHLSFVQTCLIARECCNYKAALHFVLQKFALWAGLGLCACSFSRQHPLSLSSTQQLAHALGHPCITPWRMFASTLILRPAVGW